VELVMYKEGGARKSTQVRDKKGYRYRMFWYPSPSWITIISLLTYLHLCGGTNCFTSTATA